MIEEDKTKTDFLLFKLLNVKNMRESKKIFIVCFLVVTFLTTLVLYKQWGHFNPFLTTKSPKENYIVNLYGHKERPLFFTTEVHFEIVKEGELYVTDELLHSGDSMDVSFESGYPNYRWLSENALQFYDEIHFDPVKSDKLTIFNDTDKIIKYLKIFSQSKYILLDIQPLSKTELVDRLPNGEFKGVYVEGQFSDGSALKQGKSFSLNKNYRDEQNYYIHIGNDNLSIEKQSDK